MTQDEIVRMAREAGFDVDDDSCYEAEMCAASIRARSEK